MYLIISLLITLTILAFINFPLVVASTINSLSLFFTTLFPSLFILLILFKVLLNKYTINLLKKFCPLLSYSIVLYTFTGLMLGFAGNTILLNDAFRSKQLAKEELAFITTRVCLPSFSFVVFSIGSLLNSYYYGFLLVLVQLIITLIFISINPPLSKSNINNTINITSINNILIDTGNSLFLLFSYVTIFSCLSAIICINASESLKLTILSLLEFASSTLQIASLNTDINLRFITISAILGFGSLSAHFQIKALATYPYVYQDFLKYRLIQCLLSVVISFILILLF